MTLVFVPLHGESVPRQEGSIAESTVLVEYLLTRAYMLVVVEPIILVYICVTWGSPSRRTTSHHHLDPR